MTTKINKLARIRLSERLAQMRLADLCAERGRHEEYKRPDGVIFCRQCGAEFRPDDPDRND